MKWCWLFSWTRFNRKDQDRRTSNGGGMKTASVQQVPEQWATISRWLAAGEEVEVTQQNQVVAKLVPASRPQPDFLARAKAVWGDQPSGKALSAVVSDARGGEA